MNKLEPNSLTIFLSTFLFTILILTVCDRDLSILEIKQEVLFKVTMDTADADGEVTITNHMDRIIYVPYIIYPYCSFFIYKLEQELESGQFERLWYHEYIYIGEDTALGKWINEPSPANTICMMDMQPIQLEPSQSFTQSISGLEPRKYRITVYYTCSEEASFYALPWKYHFADPSGWFILKELFILK